MLTSILRGTSLGSGRRTHLVRLDVHLHLFERTQYVVPGNPVLTGHSAVTGLVHPGGLGPQPAAA